MGPSKSQPCYVYAVIVLLFIKFASVTEQTFYLISVWCTRLCGLYENNIKYTAVFIFSKCETCGDIPKTWYMPVL